MASPEFFHGTRRKQIVTPRLFNVILHLGCFEKKDGNNFISYHYTARQLFEKGLIENDGRPPLASFLLSHCDKGPIILKEENIFFLKLLSSSIIFPNFSNFEKILIFHQKTSHLRSKGRLSEIVSIYLHSTANLTALAILKEIQIFIEKPFYFLR